MKAQYTVTLAVLAGFAAGAIAAQGLHAQAKPPAYQVNEITMLDQDAYMKEYAPKAQAAIKAAGGKLIAAGGKITALDGQAPQGRVTIIAWDSVEQAQAYRNSAAFKEIQPIRDKLAKFRAFIIEGSAQ